MIAQRKPWSAADSEQLTQKVGRGDYVADIAKDIGRTRSSIVNQVRALGLQITKEQRSRGGMNRAGGSTPFSRVF
jgi:transposase-like protein